MKKDEKKPETPNQAPNPEVAGISETSKEQQKIEELTNDIKKLQAEFENYKKRIAREKSELNDYALAEFIGKLLPVLDSFELALKNNGSDACCPVRAANLADKDNLVRGIELIYAQLLSILSDEGLRPIITKGCLFDPFRHEILMQEECDKKDNDIIEEFQKGYMLKDRIIRHSKVKVAKHVDTINEIRNAIE